MSFLKKVEAGPNLTTESIIKNNGKLEISFKDGEFHADLLDHKYDNAIGTGKTIFAALKELDSQLAAI